MYFEFEHPNGCQDCPFCFTPEVDFVFDEFNPHCQLKKIKKETDTSIYAVFGTNPTIDKECPALKNK